ncbi:cupin domain-containing protein [Sagittula salina]|uniref:Cupin domain-containing protein n=1 Tax=Sagittula salina TaxID=2820268 RepID=A0A940RYY1_9RHOB|nr:cupin domain-containing protein [Sagittula salina]
MPKVDIAILQEHSGSSYPAPHDAAVAGRHYRCLGDAGGLTQFGANLVRLDPGAMSSQRHWHEEQDEFLIVTQGTLVLVEDDGETELTVGDCAAFPAGQSDGHHLLNRSGAEAAFVVVGTRTETDCVWYSDIDMKVETTAEGSCFTHRDGTPFGAAAQRSGPGEEAFAPISAQLTRSLLEGRPELYRACFHLPARVTPRSGEGYTLTTETAVHEDFDLYREAIVERGITGITREVQRVTSPDAETCIVEAEVCFFCGNEAIVEPFITTFRLERHAGDWRIARIISSLGHIKWSRGDAGIGQDLKFELD